VTTPDGKHRYNSPPNWPAPAEGWTPPPGWQSDPAWGPAPEGWQFWVPPGQSMPPPPPGSALEPSNGGPSHTNEVHRPKPQPVKVNRFSKRAWMLGLGSFFLFIVTLSNTPVIAIMALRT